MKKKVEFKKLKPGQKFRWQRKLYVKDSATYPVQISNGKVLFHIIRDKIGFGENTLVTPVKVKITVQK